MLGRDVARAAASVNHEVVALSRADLDVLDARAVEAVMAAERPDAVVNCSAWTDVDGAESAEAEATRLNGEAAGILAEAAQAVDATVVYPSTDYVFDGTKRGPYIESDAPSPQTAYGRSKLAGERATAAAGPRHFVVRTSWLFGAGGSNFVETMLRLGDDLGEVVVVRDQVGCPTYTSHLAEGVVRLLDTGLHGTHHLAGGGECSWYEFAVEIFRMAGSETRVLSCTTDEFPRPARRPAYSVLGTEIDYPIVLPEWREGLADYLTERAAVR
ncbi:MAG: dTDP-4-dehydrorhamnose reductase [Thermoleophilaceae bacterium]|jgi:dTDP-4-dehydrorhamnose reductase|nr:dTDP-4-dehydrorhamnose reductase [Thermoleophilaceae bacterium]